ncbi:hypothetical protein AXE65_00865 [Ventosimonas gracilis]|uniref:DUF1640 domain-containing protein n=1 Tax=Ventosimonas gracilis TaxID=1680762 RepID=A0A139SWA6_9GAMM|nr:hypothetical protein [Ventosimonas gracilis]KXU38691.1 hypothetical protein AXE65_00865 [Ventosimonas gracilis]
MSAAAFNPFDTLQFAKKLKAAKVSEEQAEVVAQAFRESFDERDKAMAAVEAKVRDLAADAKNNAEKMATKEDVVRLEGRITNLEERLNGKLTNLETGLRKDMANLETGLRKDMEALGNKLIIRLTLAMLGVLGVVGTILGFVLRAALMK